MTKLAPGLQSQRTAAAISSGRPSRPMGTSFIISFMASASLVSMPSTIGVSNDTRTYSVDTDAPRGIFERSAFREPKHTVLGGVIHSPTGDAHETTKRRVADDRAAPLLAHLAQLGFHAVPNAADIDCVDAVEFFATRIGGLGYRTLHTS